MTGESACANDQTKKIGEHYFCRIRRRPNPRLGKRTNTFFRGPLWGGKRIARKRAAHQPCLSACTAPDLLQISPDTLREKAADACGKRDPQGCWQTWAAAVGLARMRCGRRSPSGFTHPHRCQRSMKEGKGTWIPPMQNPEQNPQVVNHESGKLTMSFRWPVWGFESAQNGLRVEEKNDHEGGAAHLNVSVLTPNASPTSTFMCPECVNITARDRRKHWSIRCHPHHCTRTSPSRAKPHGTIIV